MRHAALFLVTLLASFALVGCVEPPPPCMTATERGTVVASTINEEEYCSRFGCSTNHFSTILVEVNGVTRVCRVDDVTASGLQPGLVVNLSRAARQF